MTRKLKPGWAVRHARGADTPGDDGAGDCRAAAGALHAALPALFGVELMDPKTLSDLYTTEERPRRRGRPSCSGLARGRAAPARIRGHGAVQHRPRAVPADSSRPDAALRLRALPARRRGARDRRVGSDRPADDRRARRAAGHADPRLRGEPRRRSGRFSRKGKLQRVLDQATESFQMQILRDEDVARPRTA